MAQRVLQFAATIPAGTLQSAPATVNLDVDNWELEQIDLEVPAGPAGLMGFAVYNNGVQWIPFTPGTWLVWDDVQQSWPFTDQPNASGWAIVGYNTGDYDHSVIVRMHVNNPQQAQPAPAAPTIQILTTPAPTPAVILT